MPKSSGAAKPMPSHTNNVRLTVDVTEGGILNAQFSNDHARYQQGFEALHPAFPCNRKDKARGQGVISSHNRVPPGLCVSQ